MYFEYFVNMIILYDYIVSASAYFEKEIKEYMFGNIETQFFLLIFIVMNITIICITISYYNARA